MKIRAFRETLDADERQLFAFLLAAGIARAYASEEDVTGYSQEAVEPLAQALFDAVRASGLRVVGFDDET